MRVIGLFLVAALLSSCFYVANREDRAAVSDLDSDFARSDRFSRESRTVSSLAALEKSLDDFVRSEGRIPERLDELIPKFAAEVPIADTALARHRPSSVVTYYPPTVLRDGVVDGTQIKDTGGWGYVHNDRQIIVFVDCAHPDSHDRPWYREQGTFQWQR